jgi:hypothetical protein
MRKQVSEKTLELNISAELLQVIRNFPGCDKAFWIGMKQDQEARSGIDELLQNVPRGYHIGLQFKSPKALPPNIPPYRFTINDRQHSNLLRLAQRKPQSVYYIFPHFNTLSHIRASSPMLLAGTWAVRVFDLSSLPASTNSAGTHTVVSEDGRISVHSDPIQVSALDPKTMLNEIYGNRDNWDERLLGHEAIKNWIGDLYRILDRNTYALGQLLRRFSTICVGRE